MSAVIPPTIADIGTAMLADDRCFDGANRLLALYWATGVQFYTEQHRDLDPQHPSVVMAHINEEAISFEDKAALGFKFASEADRGAFCAAALKVAESVPLNSVAGFRVGKCHADSCPTRPPIDRRGLTSRRTAGDMSCRATQRTRDDAMTRQADRGP